MNRKLIKIALAAAIIAIIVVVVLKLLGQNNPTVMAGGITGGIIGGLSSAFMGRESK